jgi:hypothetical protein
MSHEAGGMVQVLSSSFRDPCGFMYRRDGALYRQVNQEYQKHYDHLMNSGLYRQLIGAGFLLPHEEASLESAATGAAYRVLEPEPLPFISYPYEWSFSQLKDAALLTLDIQKESLRLGMTLKDCSAFNVQFRKGRPVFMDTLSFELSVEGVPWKGYRQFCQHFLAPLALMSCRDVRLGQLSQIHIDGIPLDLASGLLPLRSYFRFSLFSHLHLHARAQEHFGRKVRSFPSKPTSRHAVPALVEHLHAAVSALKWEPRETDWSNYYEETNYDPDSFQHKQQLVDTFLERVSPRPKLVWDLGANTGEFSRIAAQQGSLTIAFDRDPACVERNYLTCRQERESLLLPLLLDLASPTPSVGWECGERGSLFERGPADTVLALALVHHLAISNNVPMSKLAEFFARICRFLVIEFIDRKDSQLQRLLSTRKDTFPDYTQASFEREFSRLFLTHQAERVGTAERIMYLLERRTG